MEPAPELVRFAELTFRFIANADTEALIDSVANHEGSLVIGSAPEEWWAGKEEISVVSRVQVLEMPKVDFDLEETLAWKEGTIGWTASRAWMHIEGRPSVLTRLTMVLREEGAYWRAVQKHLSVTVRNEDVLGVGLTTSVEALLTAVQDEPPPLAGQASDGSVTIIFTDIEGSTALMESLGEEPWLELLAWHDEAIRHQSALFGGTVVKGQGDGFMLAFPAPGAAVAAAVAMQRAMVSGWSGIPVPIRIGMHIGNAKADAGDFFGRTVAARVAGAAAGREILVSQAVQEQLAGAFQLGTARSVSLKGLGEHHTLFPVLWA